MRVAMVGLRGLYGPVGGIETAVGALAPRLADRGIDVLVCCRDRYQWLPADLRPGVRLAAIPTVYTKHLETILYTLLSQLRLRGVDIVHFHALGPTLLSPLPRLCGLKVVTTVHGLDWQRPRWGSSARQALRLGEWLSATVPHETLVVSRELEAHYARHYGRVTHYIPNGIDPLPHRPLDRLKRMGLETGKFLLFMGRLVPDKGCELLLEAFRQVDTDHRLVLAGDSPQADAYVSALKRQAAADPRVLLPGPLHGIEKEEALSNASAFVLPSRTEGLSIALLEAMGQGLCPIVSDIPPNLEALGAAPPNATALQDSAGTPPSRNVPPSQTARVSASAPPSPAGPGSAANPPSSSAVSTGYAFPNGSIAGLRSAIERALEAPELTRARGARAKARVLTCYGWDTAADQLATLYRALLPDDCRGRN